MPRAKHKGPYVDERLMEKVKTVVARHDKKPIKTWSRRSTILPEFVGLQFSVHNGKDFANVFVTENMVGHKLGEFSPTRMFRKHSTSQDKAKQAAATTK
ncbi:MAG: 30S ribosomal protein S19 [Candidatus Omnitrophica bacterium]|nr:30S ribosomal protein S19 [Candidatus Omnitrophota bacterium]